MRSRKEPVFQLRIPPDIEWRYVDLVHSITGFDTLSMQPFTHAVKVVFSSRGAPIEGEEFKEMSLDFETLLYRYPPFEPLSHESTYKMVKFWGDYVWLVRIKEQPNFPTEIAKKLHEIEEAASRLVGASIKCGNVTCGEYDEFPDKIRLRCLFIPRILYDFDGGFFIKLPIAKKAGKYSIIRYGLLPSTHREVLRRAGKNSIREALESGTIKKALDELRSAASYDVTTLNYFTYCLGGRDISTDPIAQNSQCYPCKENKKGYCYDGPGYGKYHYRRRAFPKVYIELRAIPTTGLEARKSLRLPFAVLLLDPLRVEKKARRGVIYFTQPLEVLKLEFEKELATDPFYTNGLVVLIPHEFINAFINILKTSKDYAKCNIGGRTNTLSMPLINILVSKYIWWRVSRGEKNVEIIVSENGPKAVLKEENKGVELSKYIADNMDSIVKDPDFKRFVETSLAHTLAHALWLSAVSYLERKNVSPESLGYFFDADTDLIVAGIYENSREGILKLTNSFVKEMLEGKGGARIEEGLVELRPSDLQKLLADYLGLTNEVTNSALEYADGVLKEIKTIEEKIARHVMERLTQGATKPPSQVENINTVVLNSARKLVETIADFINNLLKEGVYVDKGIFTNVLSRKIIGEAAKGGVLFKLCNIECTKGVEVNPSQSQKPCEEICDKITSHFLDIGLEHMYDAMFPNYCMDGCEQDLYLDRCSEKFNEAFELSRCLLLYFLIYSGLADVESRFGGSYLDFKDFRALPRELEEMIIGVNKRLYAVTPYIDNNTVSLIKALLEKPGLRIEMTLDKRVLEDLQMKKSYEELLSLAQKHKDRLKIAVSDKPRHDKQIDADDLSIITSWNFGVMGETLQNFSTKARETS
ncbi:hypothetical protein [Desulfurococcus mucosus]|uniref:hypothetical protein n=1 Tax=Desulfurococcus mucosus TaxID=2275 RepID=UPI00064E6B6F|nr:hypothetical protein [Desulfurococcus mucosus]